MVNNLESMVDYFFISINPEERPFVRKYLTWVCQQTKGTNILDVNSYKGIVSILLINLGKKVTEITTDDESISFLRSQQQNLNDEERSRFRLHQKDVNLISDSIGTFDTIIMTNNQLNMMDDQAIRLLKKLMNKDGRLIFTHPFGLYGNDFTEKASSYGMTFYPLLKNGFSCSSIEIFGVELDSIPYYWLCIAFDDVSGSAIDTTVELNGYISKLEEKIARKEFQTLSEAMRLKDKIGKISIENIERDIVVADSLENVIYSLSATMKQLRDQQQPFKIERMNSNYSNIQRIDDLERSNSELNLQINILKNQLNEEKKAIIVESSEDYLDLQQKHEIALMKLRQAINMLEIELDAEEKILRTYQELLKKHQRLEVRYDALSSSFLGRMTLRYWEFLKNKPRSKKGN